MKTYTSSLVLMFLFSNVHGWNRLKETEYDFNNCITWRDDLDAVTLTCRVPDFSHPVTFHHNGTQTYVKCLINETVPYCTPEGKNVTVDNSSHTVTIVLIEEKKGKNLDGTWYCIHDNNVLLTNVSVSEGIMVDSWVKIHGRTVLSENGTGLIEVECSSCRKPQGLITEFSVNGKTEASVWQDDAGNCIHRSLVCSVNDCNCVSTGNMFSLRIQIPNLKKTTEFSCEMHFEDTLRKGKFAKTAYMNLTGTVFMIEEPIARVIKNNEAIPTRKDNLTTLSSDTNIIRDFSPPYKEQDILKVIITCVTVLIALAVLICISCMLCRRKCRHICSNERAMYTECAFVKCLSTDSPGEKHVPSILYSFSGSNFDLMYRPISVVCKKCQATSKNIARQADVMCFDCRIYFCTDCYTFLHSTDGKLNRHTSVSVRFVPVSFSLSTLNCFSSDHQGSLEECFCKSHKVMFCKICQFAFHSCCTVEVICNMSSDEIEKYHSELDDALDDISSLGRMIDRTSDIVLEQYIQISRLLDSSTETTNISINEEGKQTLTLSPNDTKTYIEHILMSEFKNNSETLRKKIGEVSWKIKKHKLLMNFMAYHGKTKHQIMLVVSLSSELKMLKDDITETEKNVVIVLIDHNSSKNTILISTQNMNTQLETGDLGRSTSIKVCNELADGSSIDNEDDEQQNEINELTEMITVPVEDITNQYKSEGMSWLKHCVMKTDSG